MHMKTNTPHPTLSDPVNPVDHVQGPEHAPVTLIEYGDFECPSCKVAAPAARMLLQQFPNKIRFVFRHFPLEQAHPHAVLAAEASECAAAQGQFWPMHDLLFENQAHLKQPDLIRYAGQLGLDVARFIAELDDHIYLQRVREHIQSGQHSHIRTTPTFYLNGVVQDVSFGMQSLRDAVAASVKI
jgi:protein-disulfide isomerase